MKCNGDCFNCKHDDCVASQLEINFLDQEEHEKNKELNNRKRYMTKIIDQKKELSEQELAYIKKSKEERKAEVQELLWSYIKNQRAKHKTPNLFNLSEKKQNLKEYQKRYYQQHADERLDYQKRYYQQHADERLDYSKSYYQKNKERLKEYRKRYYQAKKEEHLDYQKRYYQQHKEQIKDYLKKYREKHKEEKQ